MPRADLTTALAIGNRLDTWFLPAAPANTPRYALVCDIGQGNMNALFNDHGQAFLYYDLGGGWRTNTFTYPTPILGLCTARGAGLRFILSGWDGDHVKTVPRMMGLLGAHPGTEWLAPRHEATAGTYRNTQTISAASTAIRASIVNGASLYTWPDTRNDLVGHVPSVTSGLFTVFKSNGTDANNAGLVLRIQKPGGANEYMLLTGDASFQAGALPLATHGCDSLAIAMVASHHGAQVHVEADIPHSNPQLHSLLAISYGHGNSYTHPVSDGYVGVTATTGIESYTRRGWEYDIGTSHTAGTDETAFWAGPRGNIGLIWSNAEPGPGRINGPGTAAEIDQAAIALLASAAAEIEYYLGALNLALPAAQAGAVAAAVAYDCAWALSQRADPVPPAPAQPYAAPNPIYGGPALVAPNPPYLPMPPATTVAVPNAGRVAAALLAPATGATLTVTATAAGAPEACLANALNGVVVDATYASNGNVRALADQIVTVAMHAAAEARALISDAAAQVGQAGYANANIAGSQAKHAARAVLNAADGNYANVVNQIRNAVTHGMTNTLRNAANVVQAGVQLPSLANLQDLIGAVVPEAFRCVTRGPTGSAQQPPRVAQSAVNVIPGALNGAVQTRILLGMCAAVALAPGIPINPQTPPVAAANPPHPGASRTARAAVIGVMAGLNAGAVAGPALVAAAVAAARVAMPAGAGAPQNGCHRHPRTCGAGNTCALSIHSFPQEAEILGISNVTPAIFAVGSPATVIDVHGAHFVENSSVHWAGGGALPPDPANAAAFVTGALMRVQVPAANLAAAGVFTVRVAKPGAQRSNLFNVTVADAPVITGVPAPAYLGLGNINLTVNGNHFHALSVVHWNGNPVPTAYINPGQLTVVIPAALVPALPGPVPLVAHNPDTLVSAAFHVNVIAAPAPIFNHVTTPVISVAALPAMLTLNGNNFLPGAQVNFNGVPVGCNFVSAQRLDLPLPALLGVGNWFLEVINPDGQQTNANIAFQVCAVPVLNNLFPAGTNPRAGPLLVQVHGNNFLPTAIVHCNGVPCATQYTSPNLVSFTLPAGSMVVPGNFAVTVSNVAPDISNVLNFVVNAPPMLGAGGLPPNKRPRH